MEEFVVGPLRATKKLVQPFLLCQGDVQNPLSFHLIIEDTVIPCGQDFKHAFAVLFTSFFVLGLHYSSNVGIDSVYKFLAQIVFKVEPVTPSNSTFNSMLMNAATHADAS